MAREGVTYEQVAAAAEELAGAGQQPSIRVVRERLRGTGSPNTIHRHLRRWRELRPQAVEPPAALPAAIARELQAEIARATAAARAQLESQLARQESEAAELVSAGEALEAECVELREQLIGLARERDSTAGKAAEQASENERLGRKLEGERRAAEQARLELTSLRHELEGLRRQGEAQRVELQRLRDDLAHERQARSEAERGQAALGAAHTAVTERLVEAQTREQASVRELHALRARLEAALELEREGAAERARLTSARQAAELALGHGSEEVERLRADLVLARSDLSAQRAELAEARREAHVSALERARLQGQLDALQPSERRPPSPQV